jgi:succinate dehydrogenase/fumarate reductase flavoprotein subunit
VKVLETDVLVIGSGLAGVLAARKAARMGCQVLLTSKVALKSGNTIFAGGGWLVPRDRFSREDYIRHVMEGGKHLNDAGLVQVLAERAEPAVRSLMDLGAPLEKRGEKYWYVRSGMSSRYPGDIFMEVVLESIKDQGITPLPWVSIVDLLTEEGQASGALAFSNKEGPLAIGAKAIVLATGGGGNVYQRNDNHRAVGGDGYMLAVQLGLSLKDMEFVQFYPVALAEPGAPSVIFQPPIPKEATLQNSKGEDLFKKYGLTFTLAESVMEYRDQFTLVLIQETEKETVYLDCTGVPQENWNRFCLNQFAKINPVFRNRPFAVAPVVHFFMGGIEIDLQARTRIPGLFAAGEVTAGVHGANRMGGNALTECTVFGEIAGESAARYALSRPSVRRTVKKWPETYQFRTPKPEERNLFKEIQRITWSHAGPIRSGDSLRAGMKKISDIEGKVSALEASAKLSGRRNLKTALLLSKVILKASLERKESRGAFYRKDFPQTDDSQWLKHIVLKFDPETSDVTVTHQPVRKIEGT